MIFFLSLQEFLFINVLFNPLRVYNKYSSSSYLNFAFHLY